MLLHSLFENLNQKFQLNLLRQKITNRNVIAKHLTVKANLRECWCLQNSLKLDKVGYVNQAKNNKT